MITVKNYLNRLQFSAAPTVDAAGLARLHERHLLTVPFENLDICRKKPIVLAEEYLLEKIVERRRGGFCYELNGAFHWLLQQLGFDVTMVESHVVDDHGEFGIPFDHMALRVELDRPYLADVGFGRGFLTPLAWDDRDEVQQRGAKWRLSETDSDFLLLEFMDRKKMAFVPVYRVGSKAHKLEEFVGGCHYHQTAPESLLTGGLMCSIAAPDGRVTLRNSVLTVVRNGRKEEHLLKDDTALEKEIRRYFGGSLVDAENE